VTVDDVVAAVRGLLDKTCALDPLPTTHLKAIVGVIAPFLTSLFNTSLSNGSVPDAFKAARKEVGNGHRRRIDRYLTCLLRRSCSNGL